MTERKPTYTLEEVNRLPIVPAPEAKPRPVVRLEEDPDRPGHRSYRVAVVWDLVEADHCEMGGWSIPEAKGALAHRLAAAILAGVVYEPAEIRTNVYAKTYVSAAAKVLGRTLNADLRRLGY